MDNISIDSSVIIFLILVLFNIVFFILGKLYGRFETFGGNQRNDLINRKKTQQEKKVINETIDETKYIPKIKTDDIEIKYDTIGDVKISNENIDNSINKLKSMKGQ